jgi:superfamily II DNA or RNA helicase
MLLRPRQQTFVDSVRAALAERGNTLGIAPTGAGKTVMLSACIDYAGGERALIIQHRDELVTQNRRTFHRFHRGAESGVVDGTYKQFGHNTTFAMVQTLAKDATLERLKPVDILAVDEAHHIAAGSWLKVVDRCRELNPSVRILGLTATPERGDRKSLRVVWDNVADQITLAELISSGHLIAPRTFVVDVGVQADLRGVKKSMAEYDMSAVEAIMDKVAVNDDVVRHWKDKAGDRSTVVFCSTIEHAKHVCESFRAAGVTAEVVSQETSNRDAVLSRFDRGDVQVICNVMVLTEGWDCQRVGCIILLRPSSQKSTMIQMIGRGLRPVDPERYPGIFKSDCIVLDFGTSTLQHGSLEQDAALMHEQPKGEARKKTCPVCAAEVPAASRECSFCGHEFPSIDNTPKEREAMAGFGMVEIDLLNASPFRYVDLWDDGSSLMASAFETWALVIYYHGHWHALGGGVEGGIKHLFAGEKLLALTHADDFLRLHGDKKAAAKSKTWLNLPATPKQLQILGVNELQSFGLNRYAAGCQITWRWSQRAIRAKLEATTRIGAAA